MRSPFLKNERAAALVIVLSFVVLLTGVVVVFLTRVSANRVLANGSSRQWEADQYARSALNVITGDLKQEIAAGLPVTATNVEPRRTEYSGIGAELLPNLVRRSAASDLPSRASALNSSTDGSLNGRVITPARWNKHYLLPRSASAGETDTTPDPAAGFTAPDWVFVTAAGPAPINSPETTVFGRYAYAIYDEGGLIDVNVAGYPFTLPQAEAGSKGPLAFADLTVAGIANTAGGTRQVDRLVGWRNYATAQPAVDTSGSGFPKFVFDAGSAGRYRDYVLGQTRAFTTVNPVVSGGRTDQAFASRQQMIAYRHSSQFSDNALQHLGTFSRGRKAPTWTDSATRLSGRFPLSRFDLLTDPVDNAAAIKTYFGLEHVASGAQAEHWRYTGASGATGSLQSSIPLLAGDGQDPELPVLLKYAMPASSSAAILSMIASLIDLRDTNDETTWIEYSNGAPPPVTERAFGADKTPSAEAGAPPQPAPIQDFKRPFWSAGELGYALKNGSTSVNFATPGTDAALLDLFTFNTANIRGGLVNLNTHNSVALACMIGDAYKTAAKWNSGAAADYTTTAKARQIATAIVNASITTPATGRADIPRLTETAAAAIGATEDAREVVARALSESTQTRTWNLMIDVIAQAGRFPLTATAAADLPKFVVEGEKRYWLHVAIDRFTGEVIDQQLEAVYE